MNLLVDIGNTRLKWILADQDGLLSASNAFLVYKLDSLSESLLPLWASLPCPHKLLIASVAVGPLQSELIELAQQLWPNITIVKPQVSIKAFGVINGYQQPEKLGLDRWLAMLAAQHFYPGFSCIIDCGSAITVDVLNEQGSHLGGIICPGLKLMQASLAMNISALNVDTTIAQFQFANNTGAAIANGALYAAVGLIEAVMVRLPSASQVIITGGDALAIAPLLRFSNVVDENLVFKGLSLFVHEG
jgi:type III pantothenate kinase